MRAVGWRDCTTNPAGARVHTPDSQASHASKDGASRPARHVLFLNWRDTHHPEGGGSEVFVERIAAELVARGQQATILCAAHPNGPAEQVNDQGVRLVRRGGRFTVYARAALAYLGGTVGFGPLNRRRAGRRPDVIVDVCNGLPFMSRLYSRCPVIALVHHVHREQWPVVMGPRLARFGWWVEAKVAPLVYRKCRYVTVSAATRADLATIGVDPQRVEVIRNGTPEMPIARTFDRAQEPTLAVLGRLVPHKRVEIALRTVATLAPRFPTLTLTIAGIGWWEPKLRELAAELGITDRVAFAGFVTDEEKQRILSRAWVALTPSLKEGWGLTIVEAGACGTPTVAFRDAGGVGEALRDGETGLLASDEAQFVTHVRDLLTHADQRERMGAAARRHAAGFTWAASGELFHALVAGGAPVTRPDWDALPADQRDSGPALTHVA
jgi:glycosyltransferase involved in cell wall biosynthesis